MVNEIKKEKIVKLIEEVNQSRFLFGESGLYENQHLRLAFKYDDLNEYGKIIVEKARFVGVYEMDYFDSRNFLNNEEDVIEKRSDLISKWIMYCHNNLDAHKIDEAFYFMLFSLLVVSLDSNNKEEKLSVICDFARMFDLKDDEMKDIIEIIRIIYDKSDSEVLSRQYLMPNISSNEYLDARKRKFDDINSRIKSERTLRAFAKLINNLVGIDGEAVIRYRLDGSIE